MATVFITGFGLFGEHQQVNPSWEMARPLDGSVMGGHLIKTEVMPVEYAAVTRYLHGMWTSDQTRPLLCIHVGVGRPGAIRLETRARRGPYVRADNLSCIPDTHQHPGPVGQLSVVSTKTDAEGQTLRAKELCSGPVAATASCPQPDEIASTVDVPAAISAFRCLYPVAVQSDATSDTDLADSDCVKPSSDAGLYLCEYSLYTSLVHNLAEEPTSPSDTGKPDSATTALDSSSSLPPNHGRCKVVFIHVPPFGKPFSEDELRLRFNILIECLIGQLPPGPYCGNSSPQLRLQQHRPQPQPSASELGFSATSASSSRVSVGVAVLLCNRCKYPRHVIAGQRLKDVGCPFPNQTFALPGGRLEFGESFEECATREVKEECGLDISNPCVIGVVNVRVAPTYHWVVAFVRADVDAEPVNLEPHKCAGWQWVPWQADKFPQPMFPSVKCAFDNALSPF